MPTLRDLAARAYCWISQSAWFGGSAGLRKLAGPDVSLHSTDGGRTFTDQTTGEVIDRVEAARRLAPHLRRYLPPPPEETS